MSIIIPFENLVCLKCKKHLYGAKKGDKENEIICVSCGTNLEYFAFGGGTYQTGAAKE